MRDLEKYALECMEELDKIGVEYGNIVEVVPNTRAMSRWGQCKKVPNGYSININAVLLDERNGVIGLKETILHELIHSCKDCLNHGAEWKMIADKVNKAYGYNIKRTSTAAEKFVSEETMPKKVKKSERESNYIIRCKRCNHMYHRTRASKLTKQPHLFRCGACGGELELIQWKNVILSNSTNAV